MDTLFFVASKVVWLVIRPETLFLLALGLALLLMAARRERAGRVVLGLTVLGLVLVALLPLGDLLLRPLETRFPANPRLTDVAGIIILGGGEDGAATAAWQVPAVNAAGDRLIAGIALAHRFPEARVVLSGGSGSLLGAPGGAPVAAKILRDAGIAPERLVVESGSRSTAENARLSRKLAEGSGPGRWVLVTSAWHMPRAVGSFCAVGWRRLVPYPTDHRTGSFPERIGWDLAGHLDALNTGTKEWLGLLAYRLSGRTDALVPDTCP